MPKVSKAEYKILNWWVKIDIYYNAKHKFHIPKIDPEITRSTGLKVFGYSTEADLKKALVDAIAEYHRIKTTKKKVIVYKICATASITMNPSKTEYGKSWDGTKPWAKGKKIGEIRTDFLSFDGYAFGIAYDVYFRVDGRETKYYGTDNSKLPHGWHTDPELGREVSIDHDCLEVEWTIEREKAFQGICDALEKMAERACNVLSDTQKTISLLESNQKLIG
jgi:hypothetical protein